MQKNREIIFAVVALLLIAVIIGFVSFSVKFLADKLTIFLGQENVNAPQIIKFNIAGLEQIGIIVSTTTSSSATSNLNLENATSVTSTILNTTSTTSTSTKSTSTKANTSTKR